MNQAVNELLNGFELANPQLFKLIMSLREIIFSIAPNIEENVNEEGLVFLHEKEQLSGLFLTEEWVTLEFSFGYRFTDKDGILEGTDKFSKYLKFRTSDDIQTKATRYFVQQALARC